MTPSRPQSPFQLAACALVLASLVFALWSCSSTTSAKIAQQGVTRFRSEVGSEQFQTMYANADQPLRNKHNEEDFVRLMASFQRSLGPVQQTRLTRARESWLFSKEKYVTLQYKTTWAKDEGNERFVFVIRDGQPILNSYVISANLPYGGP